jgi:hypothetical protein
VIAVDVVEGAAGIEAGREAQPDAVREPAQRAERSPGDGEPQTGERRRGPAQPVELVAGIAALVGVQERGKGRRSRELPQDEVARLAERQMAVLLAQGVVIEAGEFVEFLVPGAQPGEKPPLRPLPHHEVGPGGQHLHRHLDGRGVGDHPLRGVEQVDQHVDGDGAADQGIGLVAGDARRIVGEELRLHVGLQVGGVLDLPQHPQAGDGERHVELHLEGGRGEHGAAHPRREVVQPGGGGHRAHALGHHGNLLRRVAMGGAEVAQEGVGVVGQDAEMGGPSTLAGGAAMAAGIPGEHLEAGEVETVDHLLEASRVLMAAMEEQDRPPRLTRSDHGPAAVEQLRAVAGGKPFLDGLAHRRLLGWCCLVRLYFSPQGLGYCRVRRDRSPHPVPSRLGSRPDPI